MARAARCLVSASVAQPVHSARRANAVAEQQSLRNVRGHSKRTLRSCVVTAGVGSGGVHAFSGTTHCVRGHACSAAATSSAVNLCAIVYYMIRTARPRLTRTPYVTPPGKLPSVSQLVRTARRRLVRVARTYSTTVYTEGALGRTYQHRRQLVPLRGEVHFILQQPVA